MCPGYAPAKLNHDPSFGSLMHESLPLGSTRQELICQLPRAIHSFFVHGCHVSDITQWWKTGLVHQHKGLFLNGAQTLRDEQQHPRREAVSPHRVFVLFQVKTRSHLILKDAVQYIQIKVY